MNFARNLIAFGFSFFLVGNGFAADDYRIEYKRTEVLSYPRGILIDQSRYLDPKKDIEKHTSYSETGSVVYLTSAGKGSYDVYLLKNPTIEPDIIGKISSEDGRWVYTDKNDESYTADSYILVSRGVLLIRNSEVITYVPEEGGGKPVVLPEGFRLSAFQHGDISFSKHVLAIRRPPKEEKIISISLTTGASDYEFALVDVISGDVADKFMMRVHDGRGSISMDRGDLTGAFKLIGTPAGPIAISLEDKYQYLVARNLWTRKRVVLAERKHGISMVRPNLEDSGKLNVTVGLGLKNVEITDIASRIETEGVRF